MSFLTRLRILPRPERRFGFWRSTLLTTAAYLILVLVHDAFGVGASPNMGILVAIDVLYVLWIVVLWLFVRRWNRRAVSLGAPKFLPAVIAGLKRAAFPVACVVTLIALAFAVEYWRAARVWKSTREAIRARGEPLTFQELLGPPVPADQNFAEIPLFQGLYTFVKTNDHRGRTKYHWIGRETAEQISDRIRLPDAPSREPDRGTNHNRSPKRNPLRHTGPDLAALADAIRATNSFSRQREDPATGRVKTIQVPNELPQPPADMEPARAVLYALEGRRAVMAEITEGVRRPHCRFAVRYEDGPGALLPHLPRMKAMAVLFRARAFGRIEGGDPQGALEDVRTIFLLGERLKEDTALISYLVRVAVNAIGTSAVWHGTRRHVWNDSQLSELQSLFAKATEKDALVHAMRSERLYGQTMFDLLIDTPNRVAEMYSIFSNGEPRLEAFMFSPGFVLRQNQALHSKVLDDYVAALQGTKPERTLSGQGMPDILQGREDILTSWSPYTFLVRMTLPSLSKAGTKADRALAVHCMAACVCALERHRLAEGSYPAALADLVPSFSKEIFMDPVDGQPLSYRPEPDDAFMLYSIGENGMDDGGRPDKQLQMVDWVWPPGHPTEETRLF